MTEDGAARRAALEIYNLPAEVRVSEQKWINASEAIIQREIEAQPCEAVAELITVQEAGKTYRFACINVGEESGYRDPKDGLRKVVNRTPLYEHPPVSAQDGRVREVREAAQELYGAINCVHVGPETERAEREALTRLGIALDALRGE